MKMKAAMKNKDRFAKRLAHLGMIGMAAMVLAGCSGGSSSGTEVAPTDPVAKELNVTGKWTGEWISTADNTTARGAVVAFVAQEGNAITGVTTLTQTLGCFVTDNPDSADGIATMNVNATLDRQAISGQAVGATEDNDRIEYNLVVNGNVATGTYRILSTSNAELVETCKAGRGTVTLQRVE